MIPVLRVPLDAIAGQVTVTTSLFQLGTFHITGPQLGDLGDLVVADASVLDGAPQTSPPHPGTSAQHPGPGPGAVAQDVTCWHETETTHARWQGDIIIAIKAYLATEVVTASPLIRAAARTR